MLTLKSNESTGGKSALYGRIIAASLAWVILAPQIFLYLMEQTNLLSDVDSIAYVRLFNSILLIGSASVGIFFFLKYLNKKSVLGMLVAPILTIVCFGVARYLHIWLSLILYY